MLRFVKKMTEDVDYTVHKGSTVITIKKTTLEGLSEGEHTFTALFDDGNVDFTINIKKGVSPAAHTGNFTPSWIVVLLLGSMITVILTRKRTTR